MRTNHNRRFSLLNTVYLIAIFLLFLNCSKKTETKQNTTKLPTVAKTGIQENFEQFKQLFFTDSVFQRSRITFPLRGMSTEYVFDEEETKDTVTSVYMVKDGKFYWQKEKCHTLNVKNLETTEYDKKVTTNKNEISIKYQSKKDDYAIFFIFSLNDKNQWILTEYSDLWY